QEEDQQSFYLPIWVFSACTESSLREPTALDTSKKLLAQFCADGFCSAGDPVMIRLQVLWCMKFQHRFLDRLANGDEALEMELQAAIMQKDEHFTARDNASIAQILNDVSGGKPGASCGTSAELLRALESQSVVLEGQQFELLMSELNFDMKSWGVYTRKLGEFDLRATLHVLNYAAPSLIRADVSSANAKVAGHFYAESDGRNTAGILICPVFSYRPGLLFMEEHGLLRSFNNSNIDVDLRMQLIFDVKSKVEMQQPEDIGGGDGAFPLPTTDMGHVKGALKYAQVGPDAAYCLLHEMEGVQWSAASCLHIVDLTPLVGDFAHASLKLSWQLNVPVRYSCVVEPAMEDWLRAHLVESVTGDLLKGLIACPSGHHVPPVDPPAEHMDSKPVAPSMKRLSYVKVDGEPAGITIPDALVKTWHSHEKHGAEFRAFEDTLAELYPKPKGKRAAAGSGGGPAKLPKKLAQPVKMDSLASLVREEGSEPNGTLLGRASLLNLQGIDLMVCANGIYIKNVGQEKVTIPVGSLLCGFGKGSFREVKGEDDVGDNEIEFKVTKPECEMAVMDGVARTVHEFMKDRRAAAPDKGVLCYHDAKYDVEQWELKQ
ncbi:Uncharacterized protein SCF082_LOCUS42529, partial [Durusdinium trenchii]